MVIPSHFREYPRHASGTTVTSSQPYRRRRCRQNVMYIYALGTRHWALKFLTNSAEIIIRAEIL
jgi:hypothetical protein